MFESLQTKLNAVFDKLASRGRLTEQDVDAALREVRLALLEADVNFKVVKELVARVRERADRRRGDEEPHAGAAGRQDRPRGAAGDAGRAGQARSVGAGAARRHAGRPARLRQDHHRRQAGADAAQEGKRPLLVAADTYRPAAVTQLEVLGKQLDIPVHSEGDQGAAAGDLRHALQRAREGAYDVVILDTAGRLQINDEMMDELEQIKAIAKPGEILLVADAMTGQEAVNVAKGFHERVAITGLILTKVDGDARGGAAISMREVTGVPIKFLGVGEKVDALEVFHPDRLASRILGMGDMLSLIEKAGENVDRADAEKMTKRLVKGEFNLEDFLKQLQQLKKMGPLTQLLEMMPGMGKLTKDLQPDVTDKQMRRIEAIINSMTAEERRDPRLLNGSRKRRVAKGCGATVPEVNDLLGQFRDMQRLMKQMSSGGRGLGGGLANLFR